VSPAFGPPRVPPSTGDERELLLRFLRWKREHVAATSDGLDDEQARWTPGDRLLPILGIIHHLTLMEWRWIEGRYLGTPFPPREPDEQHPGPELTLASALTAYAARAERTEEVVRAAPSLDVPCLGVEDERGAVHEIFGLPEPVSLRWVLLHVLEDTTHHAGHADSTRELLDGRRTTG
jgi:uncharacterized damage-inducible protein DinB